MPVERTRQQIAGLVAGLFLLAACEGIPPATDQLDSLSTPVPDAANPSPPMDGSPAATPTSCTGWTCTLDGVVYVGSAIPGNELAGAAVELSHVSNCSPTSGQHDSRTGPDGRFHFQVYLHDTDSFWFKVEQEGYERMRQSVGGFDCLYCACPPVVLVLSPLVSLTPGP